MVRPVLCLAFLLVGALQSEASSVICTTQAGPYPCPSGTLSIPTDIYEYGYTDPSYNDPYNDDPNYFGTPACHIQRLHWRHGHRAIYRLYVCYGNVATLQPL
jgi:hypothetical protein